MGTDYAWLLDVDPTRIPASETEAIRNTINATERELKAIVDGFLLRSYLPGVLSAFETDLFFNRLPMFIVLILIVLVVLYYVITLASLLVDAQRAEIGLLRTRGATSRQILAVFIIEAALLAALPKAPSKYNPYRNKDLAKFRRNLVLKNLLDNDFIDIATYEDLKKQEEKLVTSVNKFIESNKKRKLDSKRNETRKKRTSKLNETPILLRSSSTPLDVRNYSTGPNMEQSDSEEEDTRNYEGFNDLKMDYNSSGDELRGGSKTGGLKMQIKRKNRTLKKKKN